MKEISGNTHPGYGKLPATAPLAYPYVPMQERKSQQYDTGTAMVRGTLFPGLDLPFLGMINKHDLPVTPMTQLQSVAFAVQELALYLDTHADDAEALELYRSYQKLYKDGCAAYEKQYGPLNHLSVCQGEYRWLDTPWPWEYSKNQEV